MLVMDKAFSRNRHFDWYEEGGKQLRSFRRIVQGLLSDLQHVEEDARIEVEKDIKRDEIWLSLAIPRFGATHRCCLKNPEYQAIRCHPELGVRLAAPDTDV
jgi:hypothetical protein